MPISTSTVKDKPQSLKPRRTAQRIVGAILVVVIAIVVAGTVTLAVGIYGSHWRSPFVKAVTRVIPIPAVSVNGRWKLYYDFLDAFYTLDYSFGQQEVLQASGLDKKPTATELEIIVLDRMIKDEIVKQLAQKRNVFINQASVDAEVKKLVDQTGSAQDVENKIRQLYQWDLETFQRRVIEPFLIRQRLQENLAVDESVNLTQRQQAEALLDRVRSGKEDFQAIAREVNEDITKSTDGDLGVFGRGERDQSLEEAAFSLEVGATSDIVRTSQGFHILKLLEKIPADEKTDEGEKVHVAHIFVAAKSLDVWLFEQSKNQRIKTYLSGYRWDVESARVVSVGNAVTSVSRANTSP